MNQEATKQLGDNAQLALKILDYLRHHPQAKDSAEGIAMWWVEDEPGQVRRVLEQLVDLNLLGKRTQSSFDIYFRTEAERAA